MGNYIDFQELKASLRIENVMRDLKLDMRQSGPQFRGQCPLCRTGGDRALAIHSEKQTFYCFPGKVGGDVIALVSHVKGTSTREAAEFLAGQHRPKPEPAPNTSPSPPPQGMAELDYLESEHPAVDAIGFPTEVAAAVGLGYASKGVMRGLVAVPLRLPDGTLIGYLGLDQARLPSKWQLPQSNVVALKRA